MLRRCSCVIALAVMLVGLPTAQAADETLTLACQGTVTGTATEEKPEQISIGVIVNFTARTVQGFGYPAEITAMDDAHVTFNRRTNPSIDGTIDRVTGQLEATHALLSKSNQVALAMNYC